VVLTHLAVAIADGADCLADLAALREQSELFGPVASIATAWRAVEATTTTQLRSIPEAIAAARATVWAASPPGESLVFDFDATLVNSYSEKEDATPTKKGFGFFPLGVWCDTTNEPLAAMLRPGRAGANDADDHIGLLGRALSGLPEDYQTGHFTDDDPALVTHPILVRADAAGATHGFVEAIVAAHCDFSIGFPIDQGVRDALVLVQEEDWVQGKDDSTMTDASGLTYSLDGAFQDALDATAWRLKDTLSFAQVFTTTQPLVTAVSLVGALSGSVVVSFSTALDGAEVDTIRLLSSATVVRSESYLPGWRVTYTEVGGGLTRSALVTAHDLVQSVVLPAGEWKVTFSYHAPGLETGIAISLAATAGLLILLVLALLVERRRRQQLQRVQKRQRSTEVKTLQA
jgi:hypothetical protein